MVSVLLIWLYMTFTCYVIGFAILSAICGRQEYRIKKESSYLFAGIMAVMIYAQCFSVFCKVGLWANGILLLFCALCIWLFRRELSEHLHRMRLMVTPVRTGIVLFLILLFLRFTALLFWADSRITFVPGIWHFCWQ